jgi:hypothetical protein
LGLVRDGSAFARDAESWPTVARILRERSEGHSRQAIADALKGEGEPTPTCVRASLAGPLVSGPEEWHAATVAKLCRNPHVRAAAAAD